MQKVNTDLLQNSQKHFDRNKLYQLSHQVIISFSKKFVQMNFFPKLGFPLCEILQWRYMSIFWQSIHNYVTVRLNWGKGKIFIHKSIDVIRSEYNNISI